MDNESRTDTGFSPEEAETEITTAIHTDSDGHPVQADAEENEEPFKKKVILTFALYLGFITTGFGVALIGPTLPDLEHLTSSTTDQLSYVVTAKSFTNFAGAFIGGAMMEKFNMWFLLGCSMLAAAPTCIMIPLFQHIAVVGLFVALSGFFYGIVICVTNIGIFKIWQEKNGPWVQALHSMFVVGMFLEPLIAGPFLSEKRDTLDESQEPDISNETEINSTEVYPEPAQDVVNLQYPYLIAGILTIISGIIFVLCIFTTKQNGFKALVFDIKTSNQTSQTKKKKVPTEEDAVIDRKRVKLTVLVFLFIFSFCTAEVLYGIYLVTFIVQKVGLDPKNASFVASVFFFVSLASRLAGIFIITKLKPVLLIFFGMSLTIFSAVLFYFVNYDISILWIASCLAAWGSATQYPTTLTWVSQYTKVSGYVGTALLVSNAFGYFIGPLLLGLLFKSHGISSFLYVLSASLGSKFLLFFLTNAYLRYYWETPTETNVEIEMEDIATKGNLLNSETEKI